MHKTKLILLCCALTILVGSATVLQAQLSSEEIARLGADLTPLGAEKAGNADGTIPAWDGGITTPPASYKPGMHHPDPFASDAISFTITADNMAEYADKLSPGYKAVLEAYPSFKMNVYPTHRSASYPQRLYDMTKEIAGTATLVENGHGVEGAINGIPFPIPKEGVEVIRRAFKSLNKKSRQAMILHRFRGLTYEKIGKEMGISISMVRKHIVRALHHISKEIENYHENR